MSAVRLKAMKCDFCSQSYVSQIGPPFGNSQFECHAALYALLASNTHNNY